MADFGYQRPSTLKEAAALLRKGKGSWRPLAGGTDLMPQWKAGRRKLAGVVDIKGIRELKAVNAAKDSVSIGPLTTLAEILGSKVLRRKLPLLARTAELMGSPQVRNRGTIGGNVCNAAPSADMAAPLIVLGAKAKVLLPKGRKTLPLEKFFLGPGKTVLGKDGLLVALAVPLPKKGTKTAYYPLTLREAMDISIVSAAVAIRKERGKVTMARIALGAVAPVPLRALKAEKALLGTAAGPEDVARAAKAAAGEAKPISDQRGTREYRRDMVAVAVERALREALA